MARHVLHICAIYDLHNAAAALCQGGKGSDGLGRVDKINSDGMVPCCQWFMCWDFKRSLSHSRFNIDFAF